jgi:hypothetical protein
MSICCKADPNAPSAEEVPCNHVSVVTKEVYDAAFVRNTNIEYTLEHVQDVGYPHLVVTYSKKSVDRFLYRLKLAMWFNVVEPVAAPLPGVKEYTCGPVKNAALRLLLKHGQKWLKPLVAPQKYEPDAVKLPEASSTRPRDADGSVTKMDAGQPMYDLCKKQKSVKQ